MNYKGMEVRDPVHGSIHIQRQETPIIKHEFFQRLRNIKQLGFAEYVFPGGTHSRFIHSLGVMCIGEKAFNNLFKNFNDSKDLKRIKQTFKLACLLHDIGHAPLSHTTECAMPTLKDLNVPKEYLHNENLDRRASHEDYTIKAIADSSFSEAFKSVEEEFGVDRKYIADLIIGSTKNQDYFSIDGISYFPILSQLVSSEMDCDRMDYLLRDSYFCGVSYGNYDLDWLLDNLEICVIEDQAFLGISERAVVTFDDFLLSRYHMFIMVYFHYRAVCLEQLLFKYFRTSPGEYTIPGDIEKYIEHDDHYLRKIMKSSSNEYAQQVVRNQIPPKIFETFNSDQLSTLERIQSLLDKEKIDYIRCSSNGRLSKYYDQEDTEYNAPDIKVVRKLGSNKVFSSINESTDLFTKFSSAHEVNRLHCEYKSISPEIRKEIDRITQS